MTTPDSSRFPLRLLGALFLCVVAGYAAVQWLGGSDDTPSGDKPLDKTYTVERGEFNITVLVDGTLDAIKRHELKCMVRWNERKIIYIVEDRSRVKKGEVVIRIDPEPREQDKEQLLLQLEEARKEYSVAEEDLAMTRASNLSSIKSAADKLRTAREAMEKYLDLEYTKKREELQAAITDADQQVADAEDALAAAQDNLAANPFNEDDKVRELEEKVSQADEALAKAEQARVTARHNWRVFRQYDHPQKLRQLRETVAQDELNLQQTIVQAKGKVIQAESRINHARMKIARAERDLQNAIDDLKEMEIIAPVDGIVTFGNPHRRHWQQDRELKVGEQINFQETVATIPDLSAFLVNVDIPEDYRSRIAEGLKATLRSPAVPDLVMEGEVTKIAPMAQNVIRWDQGSPKIYPTEISTNSTDPRLMPGMSVKVEIVVETVREALFVPVEAVYNREGETYVRVQTVGGQREQKVATGRSSLHYVEITDGLQEGDMVLLFRRPGAKG